MKHIFLNLKRFDIPKEYGGVNSIAPLKDWGAYIVSNTQEALKNPHPGGQVRPKPALGSHRERPGHPSHARHFPGRRSGALKTPPFGHRRPVPPAYPGRRTR